MLISSLHQEQTDTQTERDSSRSIPTAEDGCSLSSSPCSSQDDGKIPPSDSPLKQSENMTKTIGTSTYPRAGNSMLTL